MVPTLPAPTVKAVVDIVRTHSLDRAAVSSNPSASPAITQHMLTDYLRLRVLKWPYDQLRGQILQLYESGAIVEAGNLEVVVSTWTQRRLTFAALVGVMGTEEVEQLRDRVEPTVHRTLVVTDRTQGDTHEVERREILPTPPFITQQMLADYRSLRLLRSQYERLRQHLLWHLERGANVEYGSLDVAVNLAMRRRFTFAALEKILGKKAVK